MRIVVLTVLVIISLVLQGTILNTLRFGDVIPDLLLLLVIFTGLMEGAIHGLMVGATIGLVEDLILGKYIGIHTLTKMTVGFSIGLVEPKIYKENFLIPLIAVFFGTLFHEFLFIFLGKLVGMPFSWAVGWHTIIWPLVIYHSVIGPFLYLLFYRSSTLGWLRRKRSRD